MTNNLGVSTGSDATVKTTDTAGVHTPHHNVDTVGGQTPDYGAGAAGSGTPRVILASDDPAATVLGAKTDAKNTATDGTSVSMMQVFKQISASLQALAAALPASENHIGCVTSKSAVVDVTLSLDTSAYADGDLLADTQVVSSAFRIADGTAILQSLRVLDEDDQGVGMDIFFLNANNSFGSKNSAPSISDASARDILGRVSVSAADYVDLGGCRTATKSGLGLVLKSVSGSTDLYVAAIVRGGAPTYTASGVRLRLGLLWD